MLSYRLQHPSFQVEKEYLAEVGGSVTREALRRLTQGVALEDGMARVIRAGPVQRGTGRSSIPLVLAEGRKREVRRMLAAVGFPVRRLVRVRIGPVRMGRIRPGELRPLDPEEVMALYRVTNMRRARRGHR
jgi:23S rRNA pseudouridine2605 synthase